MKLGKNIKLILHKTIRHYKKKDNDVDIIPKRTLEEDCQFITDNNLLGLKTRRKHCEHNKFTIINKKLYDEDKLITDIPHNECRITLDEIKEMRQELRKLRNKPKEVIYSTYTTDYDFYKIKIIDYFNNNAETAIDIYDLARQVKFIIFDQQDRSDWKIIIDTMLKNKELSKIIYEGIMLVHKAKV